MSQIIKKPAQSISSTRTTKKPTESLFNWAQTLQPTMSPEQLLRAGLVLTEEDKQDILRQEMDRLEQQRLDSIECQF